MLNFEPNCGIPFNCLLFYKLSPQFLFCYMISLIFVMQNLLSGSSACSYKDLMMLKLILCSGLYPQLAIADEFNYCKVSKKLCLYD